MHFSYRQRICRVDVRLIQLLLWQITIMTNTTSYYA